MKSLKKHFLLDPNIVFLNHGSFGATPKPVFREYQRWQLELESQPVEFLGRRIAALMAASRALLGNYLGTHADNLVYTQNVTIALNMIAHSLELGPNDEVLATDHEYGAMDKMWRFLSKERSFRYINYPVKIPLTTEEDFIDCFWQGVTPRTRVIFISHITSSTALILPIQGIVRRAREAGITTVIDGAHAPGQIPLHLDSLDADFYCGNLHKWLCAPKGAGFLYAKPERQHLLKPLVISWGYESETPGNSEFIDHNEWWGTRDMAAFLSVPAAIEFQEKYEWENVRDACHDLARDALRQICELTGLGPIHSGADVWFRQMIAAPMPIDSNLNIWKTRLYDEYHIEVPLIDWNGSKLIRVSVQGYNTRRDIKELCRALSSLLKGETTI
ncbi:MAG TPA: aminotransferase class V-fold PLP-dependent enzyme [Anaerolineales bacterium]|nr:aminotransferase class V-fold PLP-dependent enzyme [Anaerolineales bacterium]